MIQPRVLSLEINTTCNCSCVFCPADTLKRHGKIMPYVDVLRYIDEAYDLGVRRLQPHLYGESHLHPRYLDILFHASDYPGLAISDTTNGSSLAKPEIADAMATYLDVLNISLDGIKPETIEKIRPGLDGRAVLKGVVDFIARKDRPRVAITTVVMDQNRDEVEAISDLCAEVHDACEMSDLHGYNPTAKKPLRDMKRPCSRPFVDLCVSVEGKVMLCCRDQDASLTFDGDLAEGWERMQAVRELHQLGMSGSIDICASCTYKGVWKGAAQ